MVPRNTTVDHNCWSQGQSYTKKNYVNVTDHLQIDDDLDNLLRGTIIIRTPGSHKNIYNPLFLLSMVGPDCHVPL